MAKKSICVNCKHFQSTAIIGVIESGGDRRGVLCNHCCQVASVKKPDYVLGDYSVPEADLPLVFCKARNASGECRDYAAIEGKEPVMFAEDMG